MDVHQGVYKVICYCSALFHFINSLRRLHHISRDEKIYIACLWKVPASLDLSTFAEWITYKIWGNNDDDTWLRTLMDKHKYTYISIMRKCIRQVGPKFDWEKYFRIWFEINSQQAQRKMNEQGQYEWAIMKFRNSRRTFVCIVKVCGCSHE